MNNMIEKYLTNIDNVPTAEKNGTLWFCITSNEKETIEEFLNEIDSIPESEWRNWPEIKIWSLSIKGNNADRILRNCIVV